MKYDGTWRILIWSEDDFEIGMTPRVFYDEFGMLLGMVSGWFLDDLSSRNHFEIHRKPFVHEGTGRSAVQRPLVAWGFSQRGPSGRRPPPGKKWLSEIFMSGDCQERKNIMKKPAHQIVSSSNMGKTCFSHHSCATEALIPTRWQLCTCYPGVQCESFFTCSAFLWPSPWYIWLSLRIGMGEVAITWRSWRCCCGFV